MRFGLHPNGRLKSTHNGYAADPKMTIRTLLAILASLLLSVSVAAALFYLSLGLGDQPPADPSTRPEDIAYVKRWSEPRGRILAVVTSTERSPGGEIESGLELTELSRAYYTFLANGYAVDIASPEGGKPPVVIDEHLIDVDYAFMNDQDAQSALSRTLRLQDVDPSLYDAVYYVGGKGVMFDFAGNADVQRITVAIYGSGGVVGAICHGPAALVGVTRADGRPLIEGRQITGFTNDEELFMLPDAREIFPFLLEDRLRSSGATFVAGEMYLENTVVDGRLVTGQNANSTWSVAEGMIRALGHSPVPRLKTLEEGAMELLDLYHEKGVMAALEHVHQGVRADKRLLMRYALLSAIRGRWHDAYHVHTLVRRL